MIPGSWKVCLPCIVSKSLLLRIFQAAFDSGSGNNLAALDSQSLNQKYGGRLDRCLFSVVNRLYRELFTRFNLPAQCSFSQMLGTSVFTYVSCHFCATGHRLLWSSSMPLDIKHVVEGMQKKLFVYCFSSFTRTEDVTIIGEGSQLGAYGHLALRHLSYAKFTVIRDHIHGIICNRCMYVGTNVSISLCVSFICLCVFCSLFNGYE